VILKVLRIQSWQTRPAPRLFGG